MDLLVKLGNKKFRKKHTNDKTQGMATSWQESDPKGTKIWGSVLSMKKKVDGTLQGRYSEFWCSQKDGEYYDSSSIHAPIRQHDDSHYVDVDVNGWLESMRYWCEEHFHVWATLRWWENYHENTYRFKKITVRMKC